MRTRLDQALVRRGMVATRARARDLILRGEVRIGEAVVTRPAARVTADQTIVVARYDENYVSRGVPKLDAALEHFGYDPTGRIALDIGASAGGFTVVLLRRGAVRVYAVDVGSGQLNARLRAHPRVVPLERTDVRALSFEVIPEPVGAIVADVSFISLAKALPAALALAGPGAWLAALIKPQFEAGRQAISKAGIVRDPATRERAVQAVRDWLSAQHGWRVTGVMRSPIVGGSGNEEFFIGAVHDG
jgi:23S rRNA (cytidine1920-2'-O)/16S rRNA (cytidine1409-2'-O)-methyltransferase